MTDGVGCDLCEGTESWIKIFMCVCVHPYQHLQDGGEGLSVLRDTADVKRSGENRRVVVLVLDVDDDLRCVGWDTQGELTLMRHIYTLRHCFCLPEARYQHPAMNLHWTCERYWYPLWHHNGTTSRTVCFSSAFMKSWARKLKPRTGSSHLWGLRWPLYT